MTSRNNVTGDKIQTKPTTKEYADGWDAIFGKAGYKTSTDVCCGKCSPCKGHSSASNGLEIENQKDESKEND